MSTENKKIVHLSEKEESSHSASQEMTPSASENDDGFDFIDDYEGGLRPTASRHDLQLGRRFFHMSMGVFGATIYSLLFSHSQAVFIVGMVVSLLYLLEQIRIHYPEISKNLVWINQVMLRAEERLKESSAIPFGIASLLVIISFPKPIALIAIYTLAIADPASAIIGILYGKKKLIPPKSYAGSSAFFVTSFLVMILVLTYHNDFSFSVFAASLLTAFIITILDLIPVRIDDNLLIPLYTAGTSWIVCSLFGIAL